MSRADLRPTLFHNPSCSKSRAALALVESRDVAVHVVRYLDDPLDVDDVKLLASMLEGPPSRLLRPNEPEYAVLGLSDESSLDEVAIAIAAHPNLLERPILVVGTRAVIGRPLEALQSLLDQV